MFNLYHPCQRCHNLIILDNKQKFCGKMFIMPGVDTGPDRHALDADLDPTK
jgi:hypothetical protein